MGDVVQEMGEMKGRVNSETEEILAEDEGLHPHSLDQSTPWPITVVFSTVFSFIAANGWYAVGLVVFAALLWRLFNPKINDWLKKRESYKEAAEYHKNPDLFLERERAIDDARRRLQERYSHQALEQAQIAAEKQKEKEEQKRQELIEDWERHQRGAGYRSKSRLNATNAAPVVPAATSSTGASGENKGTKKPALRPEYNPMTGDIGGGPCRWRPDRSRPSGGG